MDGGADVSEIGDWLEEYAEAVHNHQLAPVAAWLANKAIAQGIPKRMHFEWRPEVAAVLPSGPYALSVRYQRHDRRLRRDVARAFAVPRRMLRMDGPPRLCVDGHAYRRRQRARRRRSR